MKLCRAIYAGTSCALEAEHSEDLHDDKRGMQWALNIKTNKLSDEEERIFWGDDLGGVI